MGEAINALAEEPRPPGASAVRGFPGHYRLRFGDYRLAYEVQDAELAVLVVAAGHRSDVYKVLRRRGGG